MALNLYRRDIRFPAEMNAALEKLKSELELKSGKTISMNSLVVEIVGQFLSRSKAGALRKEAPNAEGPVRPHQDEGAARR